MRAIILILLMLFAVPALAQQEPECRGKKSFKFGDGSYGCLLKIEESGMTRSQSKRYGFGTIHSSSQSAALVIAAIFGDYDKSRRVADSRLRKICATYAGDVKKAMAGKPYSKVIVRMYWPRIAAPKKQGSNNNPLYQQAYMSQKCTGIGHFGTRPS